ncbi:MAG: ECF transporter S component [Anaerolineaceae bacterium]|nr:ECF transporter S component [Anaerolineaceae bacterium]
MSEENASKRHFYFTTRDLLIMAVLAALGGVASTYINALGDAVEAFLGFPGATQWAAGLHVIWIVLAIAITGKPGTGVLIGALKGAVELMSGNSHGVIVLLVDLVAGLLVDFGFLLFKNKKSLLPYILAGGLASGSNVLVFQIFATLPENIVAASAILILFLAAFVSGVVFAGLVPYLVINALIKAGVVRSTEQTQKNRKTGWYILLAVVVIAALLTVYLRGTLMGPSLIEITGDVSNPYSFPSKEFDLEKVTRQMDYKGVTTEYSGYPVKDIIAYAEPSALADTLLIQASDGYAFLIGYDELETNDNILIVQNGSGKNASIDIVGPESSKAWVRNVTLLSVITSESLTILDPTGETQAFDPDTWISEMDSTQVGLPDGYQKLQGVSVWKVIQSLPNAVSPTEIVFKNTDEEISLPWSYLDENDNIRIFTVIGMDSITYALSEMSGDVLLYPVTEIEIH